MLTRQTFDQIRSELNTVYHLISLHWGSVQNNDYDMLITSQHFFEIKTLTDLDLELAKFANIPEFEKIKIYYYRRWFITMCAKCDEFLFYREPNVIGNPVEIDYKWDVRFLGGLWFDIKSTVIPFELRLDLLEHYINNPTDLIRWFYTHQSKGVRNHTQNRLFLVYHSYIHEDNEFNLRLMFGRKSKIAQEYAKKLSDPKYKVFNLNIKVNDNDDDDESLHKTFNIFADVIYIFENLDGSITHKIASESLNQN